MAAEVDIPETGAVFTFGRSRFSDNIPSRFWLRNDPIRQLACGDQHTALVTESGRIFMFGANDWGQLGVGHTHHVQKPSCIKALKHEKVSLVACGGCHTLLATDSGKIYSFGANGEGQLGVSGIDKSVEPYHIDKLPSCIHYKAVTAGFEHSACLTESGAVYMWGSNSEGQLGCGDITESCVPSQLLPEETISAIAVGYYHTALLTEKGCVYIFGETEGGKLGLGNEIKNCHKPVKLTSFDANIGSISCGSSHTAFITKQHELYTFGTGPNGELGQGTNKLALSIPQKVCLPFKVESVSCGANHTAIVSEDGYLYTFGDSRHGKLAQGEDSYSNQFEPCLVDRFEPFIIDKVVCGGCHMMVVAHNKPSVSVTNYENTNSSAKLFKESLAILNSSADFSGTLTARDRRRQTTESNSSLNRTLPSLSGKLTGNFLTSSSLENIPIPSSEGKHIPKHHRNKLNGKDLPENISKSQENNKTKQNHEETLETMEQKTTQSPMKNCVKTLAPKPAPRKLKPREIVTQEPETDKVEDFRPEIVSLNNTEKIFEEEFTETKQDLPSENIHKVSFSNDVTLDRIENEECLKEIPTATKTDNLQTTKQEQPNNTNTEKNAKEKVKKEDIENEIKEFSCSEEESASDEDESQKNKNIKNNIVTGNTKDSPVKKKKYKKPKLKKRNKESEENSDKGEGDQRDEKLTEDKQLEVKEEDEVDNLEKSIKDKQKGKKRILTNIFGRKKVVSQEEEENNCKDNKKEKESEEKKELKESSKKKKESKKKENKSDKSGENDKDEGNKQNRKMTKKQNFSKSDSVSDETEEEEEEEEEDKDKDQKKKDAKDDKTDDQKKGREKGKTNTENEEKDKNSKACVIL